MQNISTCLWFDNEALQAVTFYVTVFPNSRVVDTKYYLEGAPKPAGEILTVQFSLDGTEYLALNGGPGFAHSEAMSMVAYCDDQMRVDELWEGLSDGGEKGQCGWLKDKFGVSWQIVPRRMLELLNTDDTAASQRAFSAMMQMTKIDIAAIERAYAQG